MKTKLLIIVAIIVIVMLGILAWGTNFGSSSYWETENEFGIWQDELIVEFSDGSTQSLKLINEGENKPLTVYYGGKAITKVNFKLSAKATGEGYDGAEIDTTGFGYDGKIYKGSTEKDSWAYKITDMIYRCSLGSTKELLNSNYYMSNLDNNPSKFPDGDYTIKFIPKGTVKYRGYPSGGDWTSATLPPTRTLDITIQRGGGGQIVVTLYSEASA